MCSFKVKLRGPVKVSVSLKWLNCLINKVNHELLYFDKKLPLQPLCAIQIQAAGTQLTLCKDHKVHITELSELFLYSAATMQIFHLHRFNCSHRAQNSSFGCFRISSQVTGTHQTPGSLGCYMMMGGARSCCGKGSLTYNSRTGLSANLASL